MRRKGVDKEETRRKIIDAVGRGFRKHGYAGIGVDGLAKAAGVTSGAFYSHLGSKEAAFAHTLEIGLDEVIQAIPEYQREHGTGWVEAFAQYYLGAAHRGDLECGCAMASLTPEVVRFGAEVHGIFETKMARIADLVADGLDGGSDAARLARAWAMLSVLIGGINITRAMENAKMTENIAQSIRDAATKAAGNTRAVAQD